jgi:molecular chaperone GrpE
VTHADRPEGEAQASGSPSPEGAVGAQAGGLPHHHDPEHKENDPVSDMVEEGAPLESSDDPVSEEPNPLEEANVRIAGLTNDLQRLQAEFLNYKRRVDRDRDLIRENATFAALTPITEVLDTIDRAREHGPLDDGFKAVADQLESTVARQGLVRFGAAGDSFDPMLHEALSHLGTQADIEVTTVKVVARAGYKMGDRVVRAAQVLVVDPES